MLFVFAIAMMAGAVSFANPPSFLPDMENSWVEMPECHSGECYPVLFNVPNGTGSAFAEARDFNTVQQVDASIALYLRDSGGVPVLNFPREDIWLDLPAGTSGWTRCPLNGTIADTDSDAFGVTTWVNPLFAGGWTEGPTVVMINGNLLLSGNLNLAHNSPDINGDGYVNLTDVAMFAADFYGAYAFRSDFHYDGVLNLQDIAKLAQASGATCP